MRYLTSFLRKYLFPFDAMQDKQNITRLSQWRYETQCECVARIGSASGAFNLLFDKMPASSSNILIFTIEKSAVVCEQRASSANNLLWGRWKQKKKLGKRISKHTFEENAYACAVYLFLCGHIGQTNKIVFVYSCHHISSLILSTPILKIQDSFK